MVAQHSLSEEEPQRESSSAEITRSLVARRAWLAASDAAQQGWRRRRTIALHQIVLEHVATLERIPRGRVQRAFEIGEWRIVWDPICGPEDVRITFNAAIQRAQFTPIQLEQRTMLDRNVINAIKTLRMVPDARDCDKLARGLGILPSAIRWPVRKKYVLRTQPDAPSHAVERENPDVSPQ